MDMNEHTEPESGTAVGGRLKRLVMHAVSPMLDGCGNSYVNAYTEKWLRDAKVIGAYHGPVIGNIRDVKNRWEMWLDQNGGLPDL